MFKSMLYLHWKQVRFALLPFVIAAFGLPLATIQGLGNGVARELNAYEVLSVSELWLPVFPFLALAVGATLALSAWNWDHQLKHVYALSLPVSRWRYSTSKLLAGAALLAVPGLAFWMGAHVAVSAIELPSGLTAYPNELAVRFFMASLLTYAGAFALASGTARTTIVFLSLLTAFFVGGGILDTFFRLYGDGDAPVQVVTTVLDWMVRAGGPLDVLTGSWTLIDV